MKSKRDEAIADVRNARKSLCDRFGNNPHRLLKHLPKQQQGYRGRVIKLKAPPGEKCLSKRNR